MNDALLNQKYARIGARLALVGQRPRQASAVSLDVKTDRRGEFFEIARSAAAESELHVLDVQPGERHLLLLVRDRGEKQKFLCGHDERHWFVAGIPEAAPVGTVRQAKEALKPAEVRSAQARQRLDARGADRRKNRASIRQGEWFFLPEANITINPALVLRHEPLSRGAGSKPHWAEFCFRNGGETVYICSRRPNGATGAQYKQILSENPLAKHWSWKSMRRNAGVFVRGRIRHADHKTVMLKDWHRVLMNTESQSKAMRHVAFLD